MAGLRSPLTIDFRRVWPEQEPGWVAQGVPLIGPLPECDGLSVASGHDSVGIMLSPGTAELVADYIRTGDEGPLQPFSPARFGTNARTGAQE